MNEKELVLKVGSILKHSIIKVVSVAGIALFVFLTISMISYDKADIPEITQPYNTEPVNFFGNTGANSAFMLISHLGLGSIVFLIALVSVSLNTLLSEKANRIILRSSFAMLYVICFSGLIAQWDVSFIGSSPTAGGIVGFTLLNLLSNIFELQATRMLLMLGFTTGLLISTDLLYFTIISEYFNKLRIRREEKRNEEDSSLVTRKISVELKRPENSLEEVDKEKTKKKFFLKRVFSGFPLKRYFTKFKKTIKASKKEPDMTIPEELKITEEDLLSPDKNDSGFHEIKTYFEEEKVQENEKTMIDTPLKMKENEIPQSLPDISMLNVNRKNYLAEQNREVQENAALLYEALKNYSIKARIKSISVGPTVSMYEIDLAPGTKIKRLSAISSEIAMVLRAPSVRVVAPIPGKSTVGIEVPNKVKNMVIIRDMLENPEFEHSTNALPIALGLTSVGEPIYADLAKMPHLLIAGTTGSGKSVAANIIITSIIYKFNPQEVKFVLIDPKMVEFSAFKNIPHLMYPVITEVSKAPHVLAVLVEEMEERYRTLEKALCKNIAEYNDLTQEELKQRVEMAEGNLDEMPDKLPYIITVIDELADLMMVAGKEIESSIVRLAQKSRAVGIHLIIATQRPSVDVITGLIKANIPCRMAFRVLSQIDSRTILDRPGAEKLLGSGDMLYLPPGSSDVIRVQNAYISNNEILKMAQFLKKQGSPNFKTLKIKAAQNEYHKDEEFIAAAEFASSCETITTKAIAQALGVGNKKAAELITKLEDFGVIGSVKGNKARDVLMCTREFFNQLKEKAA